MVKKGWHRESARHSLAARGVKSKFKKMTVHTPFKSMKISDKKIEDLAASKAIEVVLPHGNTTLPQIRQYMKKNYGLDVDIDEESDFSDRIFYNSDLRSICGTVLDWGDPLVIELTPRYWAGEWGTDDKFIFDKGYHGNNFKKLIRDSSSCVVTIDKNGLMTGHGVLS